MSTPAETILTILQDQEDPLTSHELADCSGFTQTEVLKALGELNETHSIQKSAAGYKLLTQSDNESPELRQLLTFFTKHNKAFLPKALREALGFDKPFTSKLLNECKTEGLITFKNNGTYYLSPAGVRYIQQHYPDVEIKAFVLDKAKEHSTQFQIVPPHRRKAANERKAQPAEQAARKQHPAITQAAAIARNLKLTPVPAAGLKDVPVKIEVLNNLATCFGSHVQEQLQELVSYLQEYQHEQVS